MGSGRRRGRRHPSVMAEYRDVRSHVEAVPSGPERHRDHGGYRSSMATVEIWKVQACLLDCTEEHPYHYQDVVVGEVTVEVCNTCLHVVARCLHTQNTWHDDGSRLLCDACGADVT